MMLLIHTLNSVSLDAGYLARLAVFLTLWEFYRNVWNSHIKSEFLTFYNKRFWFILTKSSEILTFLSKSVKLLIFWWFWQSVSNIADCGHNYLGKYTRLYSGSTLLPDRPLINKTRNSLRNRKTRSVWMGPLV